MDESDCKIRDIYNYEVGVKFYKEENNERFFRVSIEDSNGVSLYVNDRCKFIYQIGFWGESAKIKTEATEDGLVAEQISYWHYAKNKNHPMYRGVRKTFMEDTLAKDTLYLQRPRKVFIDKVISNRATANKWLLEMAYKFVEGDIR